MLSRNYNPLARPAHKESSESRALTWSPQLISWIALQAFECADARALPVPGDNPLPS